MTADPTRFPDLNRVLGDFVTSARTILGESFCGAYLQGSFAVGGADEHSDVDFVVVTRDEVDEGQFAALDAMHGRLYALDGPWGQHLEGSYITAGRLRPSIRPGRRCPTSTTEPVSWSGTITAIRRSCAGPCASMESSWPGPIRTRS